MKAIFTTLVGLLVVCVTAVWIDEYRQARRAAGAMTAGDGTTASMLYTSLIGRRLWFVDRHDLLMRREAAAAGGLGAMMRDHDFSRAVDMVQLILSGPETGHESGARSVLREIPLQHMNYIRELTGGGHFDKALAEVGLATALYGEWPSVLKDLKGLRAAGQAGLAEERVLRGNPDGAIDVLADFESAAPIQSLRQARDAARHAVVVRAAELQRYRMYPDFLEWYPRIHARLVGRPEVLDAVALAYADMARRTFDLPATSAVPEALDVDEPPPARAVSPTIGTGVAMLLVVNRTGQPIAIVLRGPRDYRTPTPIPPGESVRIAVRPGRYAQAVHAGQGLVPFLGVVQFAEAEYTQEFSEREHGILGSKEGRTPSSATRSP
jgi:hypothetical protein